MAMIRLIPITAMLIVLAAPAVAQHADGSEPFTMALTGDSIITRRLSVYEEPAYLRMIDIMRNADVAFTNLEMLFHDYEPWPMAESGGTWMRAEPALAADLAWTGIDMVSRANNHTGDYGTLGMELTTKYTAEAGLVQAGVGMSLAEAREAKFLETAKARVALISVASSFADHMRAGASRDNVPARPGLNPLRYKTVYVVPGEDFANIERTAESLGQFTDMDGHPRGRKDEEPDAMEVFGRNFERGDSPTIRRDANQADINAIAAVVSNASRLADYTIVTIHAHEYDRRRNATPEFLKLFARSMIEAGADVFVGHGPHVLRGVEIYRGKPIMYSLGNFIFQNETLQRLPYDNYERYKLDDNGHVADFNDQRYKDDTTGFPTLKENWESVIAVPTFTGGELSALAFYPIDLAFGASRQVRGRPILANGDLAEKIIGDLETLSAPYGTRIEYRRGVGYVDLTGN